MDIRTAIQISDAMRAAKLPIISMRCIDGQVYPVFDRTITKDEEAQAQACMEADYPMDKLAQLEKAGITRDKILLAMLEIVIENKPDSAAEIQALLQRMSSTG